VLLKHRQDGFWEEGNLCVHGVTHSVRILTDSSGETASTPKIVSDVARTSTCRCGVRDPRWWLRAEDIATSPVAHWAGRPIKR
jgi:hypothetical protein